MVLILLRHKVYTQHRVAMLIMVHMITAVMPSGRSPATGTALLLQRPPAPGARGALMNFLRVTTGAWQRAGEAA